MALPWVRMDTQWPHNPKFLVLVEEKRFKAITVYWGSIAWSGAQGLNGFLPAYALSSLVQLLRGRNPYRENHFERQAYAATARRRPARGSSPG